MKKKTRIRKLLLENKSYSEIVKIVGCSKATISYHSKKLGLSHKSIYSKRYDWMKIQKYHDAGRGMRDCMRYFGFAAQTWQKARERKDIVSNKRQVIPLNKLKHRSSVRRRVIKGNLLPYKCSICGVNEWQKRSLSLNLDHINGIKDDHRLENLRWVCPNCDAQLPTYSGRNIKRNKD